MGRQQNALNISFPAALSSFTIVCSSFSCFYACFYFFAFAPEELKSAFNKGRKVLFPEKA